MSLVLGNTTQIIERSGRHVIKDKNQKSQGKTNPLNNICCVPSNVQVSHQEIILLVLKDNEAVIKMIIKRRSPTMRHVYKTQRFALDWLFDRIQLDPQIQIKYIDTQKKMLTLKTKEISHVMTGIVKSAC